MKKILIFLLFIGPLAFAQKKQNIYFFKNDGREVSVKDSADFIRIIQEPDSGSTNYILLEYYSNNNKKRFGQVSKFEPRLTFEGVLISYYRTGKREEVASYEKGIRKGEAFFYYENGQLKKTVSYSSEEGMPLSPVNPKSIKYKIISFYDSTGVQTLKEGNGSAKEEDDKGTVVQEGNYVNGVKDGIWKGSFVKSGHTFEEQFESGVFISGIATLNDGTIIKYNKQEEYPDFKGGIKNFSQYLLKSFRYSEDAKRNGVDGRVIVSFFVETDGSLSNIKLVKDIGLGTGEEAVRVVKNSPAWIPGQQHGVPVRVAYKLPISLKLTPGYNRF